MTEVSDPKATFPETELRIATFQHRLGAYALDAALALLTLFVGWLIWSMIIWGEGQTPAKKILGIRVYSSISKTKVTWGHMAVREFLIPFALVIGLSVMNLLTFGILGTMGYIAWIVLEIVWYFTKGSLTLRDIVVKTLVVNEAK